MRVRNLLMLLMVVLLLSGCGESLAAQRARARAEEARARGSEARAKAEATAIIIAAEGEAEAARIEAESKALAEEIEAEAEADKVRSETRLRELDAAQERALRGLPYLAMILIGGVVFALIVLYSLERRRPQVTNNYFILTDGNGSRRQLYRQLEQVARLPANEKVLVLPDKRLDKRSQT